jgi:hypothetical protein
MTCADKKGYVYFISAYHMKACGYFKIGITNCKSYKPRMQQIQSCNPFYIIESCVVTHSKPYELEQAILKKFKEYRVRGEWFIVIPDRDDSLTISEFEERVVKYMKKHSDGEVVV